MLICKDIDRTGERVTIEMPVEFAKIINTLLQEQYKRIHDEMKDAIVAREKDVIAFRNKLEYNMDFFEAVLRDARCTELYFADFLEECRIDDMIAADQEREAEAMAYTE